MFNINLLLPYFLERIGFRQSKDSCTPKIHPDLLIGSLKVESVRDGRAFLQAEKIYDMIDDFAQHKYVNIPIWDIAENYEVGDRVRYNDGTNEFVYVSLLASVGEVPIFDSVFWETNLSSYLRLCFADSVEQAISSVVIEESVASNTSFVLGANSFLQEIDMPRLIPFEEVGGVKQPNFEYVALRLNSVKHINLKILQIGIRTELAETIPMYLYHSSQSAPIATFTIDTLANEFSWIDIPIEIDLSFLSNNNSKGMFLLGFYQDDLVGNVYFNRISKVRNRVCTRFNGWFSKISNPNKAETPNLGSFYSPITYFEQIPFNFRFSSELDYTHLLLENQRLSSEIIQYSVAFQILLDAKNSTKVNREQSKYLEQMETILYGKNEKTTFTIKQVQKGLENELQAKKEALKIATSYVLSKSPLKQTFRP